MNLLKISMIMLSNNDITMQNYAIITLTNKLIASP